LPGEAATHPNSRPASASVAEAVVYLRDATFVTGETLTVNGGEDMR
jgi:NAD(P)-dependent dehydrogenase (short-subunit alcohol dehydrogenase family)